MKKKRFDRDIWNFDRSVYYQLVVDIKEFQGLVCLLKIDSGNKNINDGGYQYWDRPIAGRVAICGEGMIWLQLIPNGKSHALTVKYLKEKKVSIWYTDIIQDIEYDTDGVAVFVDKYLDVTFTPEGDISIDDRDELDEAYEQGILTKEQYESAIVEGDLIVEEYCADISKTQKRCDKILAYVLDRIEKGEYDIKI